MESIQWITLPHQPTAAWCRKKALELQAFAIQLDVKEKVRKLRGTPDFPTVEGRPSPVAILEVVAKSCRVEVDEILGPRRFQGLIFPRQLCCYLLREMVFPDSLKRVEGVVGRDHSTVLYSVRKVARRMQKEPRIGKYVNELIDKIIQITAEEQFQAEAVADKVAV